MADATTAPDLPDLERLVSTLAKRARKRRRIALEQQRQVHDQQVVSDTGRVQVDQIAFVDGKASVAAENANTVVLETDATFATNQTTAKTSVTRTLRAKSRRCYICSVPYRELHEYYHWLCPSCAQENSQRRQQSVSLLGRYALVTGGRIKIGFQTALKLLRWGAQTIVTTRFPQDAQQRFAREPDYDEWQQRLTIMPVDFLHVAHTRRWLTELEQKLPALDILINNAAQTVRRSAAYYHHLAAIEAGLMPLELQNDFGQNSIQPVVVSSGPAAVPVRANQQTDLTIWHIVEDNHGMQFAPVTFDTLARRTAIWPLGTDGEFVETREQTSWSYLLAEVPAAEMLEVMLINTYAPFLLIQGLKPLMIRSPFADRYIINVTGADGLFQTGRKPARHPHVNMSKAALNMLTRTVASDYALSGIYMNSVDTGWISFEGSYSRRQSLLEQGKSPPLDARYGASRILDPIVRSMQNWPETPKNGLLYRHYQPVPW